MVEFEENYREQTCACTLDRQSSKLLIEKEPGGHIFFRVKTEKGILPQQLSGRYTSMAKAKEAIELFDLSTKQTSSARRTMLRAERELKRGSVPK